MVCIKLFSWSLAFIWTVRLPFYLILSDKGRGHLSGRRNITLFFSNIAFAELSMKSLLCRRRSVAAWPLGHRWLRVAQFQFLTESSSISSFNFQSCREQHNFQFSTESNSIFNFQPPPVAESCSISSFNFLCWQRAPQFLTESSSILNFQQRATVNFQSCWEQLHYQFSILNFQQW